MQRPPVALLSALVLLGACSRSPAPDVYGGSTAGSAAGGAYGQGAADPSTTTSGLDPQAANGAVAGTQQDFEVNVGDRVYFGYDATSLDDAARGTL
ncbi:MAG: hypothetical protein KDG89_17895, partial [Geminicoccaceae bacterium]|nr:hypothetical protein [Geminicoccaceae bacterium]